MGSLIVCAFNIMGGHTFCVKTLSEVSYKNTCVDKAWLPKNSSQTSLPPVNFKVKSLRIKTSLQYPFL